MQATKTQVVNSIDELRDLLLTAHTGGCEFCSVQYTTEPSNIKSPKTSGMAGRILKIVQTNPLVGKSMEYINSVNNRLAKQGREPIDHAKPRKWGHRLQGTPFVVHKGKVYLEANIIGKSSTEWLLDEQKVEYSQVEGFLRPKKNADTYDLGEDAPVWRDIRLDHIDWIQINHVKYVRE